MLTLSAIFGNILTKKTTNMRSPIPPEVKLAITLRFLATGESYSSLMYQYRVSQEAITDFVPRVCDLIMEKFKDRYMKFPDTEDEWLKIAENFEKRWQFPNCFGAVDGKHIAITKPPKSGSTYHNYKSFHSIVLLALVDAFYRFTYVDIGCQGRISDGGVLRNTDFFIDLE